MFIAVAAPDGGLGGFPALVKGDTGDPATLDSVVNLTALASTDATADSASFTDLGGGVFQLNLVLHKGPTGAAGSSGTIAGASDLSGSAAVGKIPVVTGTGPTAFAYATQKVGDRWIPASISNTTSGNPLSTLCPVGVPAQDFDWRPHVEGYTVVTGTGANVQVDLIARLNGTSGNIVGRATSVAGQFPPPLVLSSGPPAGSADSYDKVLAGNAATIYLRAERQSGSDTFTTSGSTTGFCVEVRPVP